MSASGWLFKNKSFTMHGNMNVKLRWVILQISPVY